jgi:hypothetical protein
MWLVTITEDINVRSFASYRAGIVEICRVIDTLVFPNIFRKGYG